MTTLTVTNYRGITSAEIEIAPIALIAGKNGAGKSSIAQAAGAVMTASPVPLEGFLKKDADQLVHEGEKRGRATLGGASITFPGGSASGKGPRGSAVAAGLDQPLDMRPGDAAKYLSGVLNADPTREDLDAALPDLSPAVRDKIWASISAKGWDQAHKHATESRIKNKGKWEQITGQKYGARAAQGWVPSDFADSVPDRTELDAALKAAQSEYDKAVSQKAVSADWLERTQKEADSLAGWADAYAEAEGDIEKLTAEREKLAETHRANVAEVRRLEDERDALPEPGAVPVTVDCPECGTHLIVVSQRELAKADGGPDEAENVKRQASIDGANHMVREADTKAGESQAQLNDLDRKLNERRDALRWAEARMADADKAAAAIKAAPTTGATDEQITAALDKVHGIEYQQMMLNAMEAAEKAAATVLQSETIVAALAPEGVRQAVLAASLESANADMAALCDRAGYPPVEIDQALQFTLGDRQYRLLSGSEQFRVRLVSQMMLAQRDGSQIVVIDAADILDGPGRNGLFKILKTVGIDAVVCMTMNKLEDVPDVSRLGAAYWIEGGTARRIGGDA